MGVNVQNRILKIKFGTPPWTPPPHALSWEAMGADLQGPQELGWLAIRDMFVICQPEPKGLLSEGVGVCSGLIPCNDNTFSGWSDQFLRVGLRPTLYQV